MPPRTEDALARHPLIEALVRQRSVAVAVVDRDLRYVRVNEALAALNGAPAEAHIGRRVADVLPPEAAAQAEPLLLEALGGRAIVDVDATAPAAGGHERRFTFSYLPIVTGDGIAGVLVLLLDSTARSRVEAELATARHRLYLALEGTNTGTFEYDIGTGVVQWSDNLGPLFGRARGWSPATYDEYAETVHPDDREELAADVARAAAAGVGYDREFRARFPDGSVRWRESQVHVVADPAGRPAVLVGLVHDIDARKQREWRTAYLARASLALAESLDLAGTLQHVAELAVGELGDWCSVVLRDETGSLRTVAVAHDDPAKVETARQLHTEYPYDADGTDAVAEVIRAGRPILRAEVSDEMLRATAADERQLALMRALELGSLLIVPMVARGRTLGAIVFASPPEGRTYGPEDLDLAVELGRRAGLALDNARLYETVRDTAVTLQRSLLPSVLPEVEGWQIATRYLPGQAGAAVGGDWYDAFVLPDGRLALVVGDVMGRGVRAAAGMGHLRSALQAHLHATGDPVLALAHLDELVGALRPVSFATALAVAIDPRTGIAVACTAGHPPPLLRGADTRFVAMTPGPPIAAGIAERLAATDVVAPGETLLLYTDGLVEARGAPLDARLDALREAAARAPAEPEALLDLVLGAMLSADAPDDVAVIAVRRRA